MKVQKTNNIVDFSHGHFLATYMLQEAEEVINHSPEYSGPLSEISCLHFRVCMSKYNLGKYFVLKKKHTETQMPLTLKLIF